MKYTYTVIRTVAETFEVVIIADVPPSKREVLDLASDPSSVRVISETSQLTSVSPTKGDA